MNKLMLHRRQFLGLGTAGVVALLSGCGFHLRGNFNYPFQTIYIAGQNQSPVALILAQILAEQVQVVKRMEDAQVILTILEDKTERVASALGAAAQVNEVELRQFVGFTLASTNNMVPSEPVNIVITRFVSYSESQAIAKEAELEILYGDMRNDAVRQVLRRLTAYKPA